jgi:hypothetical protein
LLVAVELDSNNLGLSLALPTAVEAAADDDHWPEAAAQRHHRQGR